VSYFLWHGGAEDGEASGRVDPDTEKVMLLSRIFDLYLSAEHGFRINHPELQQQIQQAASTSRTKMVLEERDREE
jgi:hypothetical protein